MFYNGLSHAFEPTTPLVLSAHLATTPIVILYSYEAIADSHDSNCLTHMQNHTN